MSADSAPAEPWAAPEQAQEAFHSLPCARSHDTEHVSPERPMPLVARFTGAHAWDEERGGFSAAGPSLESWRLGLHSGPCPVSATGILGSGPEGGRPPQGGSHRRGTPGLARASWLQSSYCYYCFNIQFSSVAQSCLTLCDPMNRSMPGLPDHHQLLKSTQTHVHRVGDAIQPSHPLSSPSLPARNRAQHQGLFQ